MMLSTQSLDELRKSDILDVILESCVTKIFLANPDMDRDLYQRQFHLNDHEIELITGLIPKQQMLIKTPDTSKVANLNVDAKSYWLYTNDPFDNRKREEAFATYGFEKGLEVLANPRSPSTNDSASTSRRISMKLLVCRTLSAYFFSLCSLAHAESIARIVKYSQTDIIPIRAKVRFSTLIVLPADEEILDFTTGDKDFWIINGAHNLCYLHPAQAGIRSNLNLVTASGHVYSFLLTEISKEASGEPDLKVFVAPNDQSSVAGNAETGPSTFAPAKSTPTKKKLPNFAIRSHKICSERRTRPLSRWMSTSGPIRPSSNSTTTSTRRRRLAPFLVSAIYHDDRFTYIKSTASEKPTIYEIKDKKPNLVNFDLENGVYVVPKIIDSGYLVVGKKRVTFNRNGN